MPLSLPVEWGGADRVRCVLRLSDGTERVLLTVTDLSESDIKHRIIWKLVRNEILILINIKTFIKTYNSLIKKKRKLTGVGFLFLCLASISPYQKHNSRNTREATCKKSAGYPQTQLAVHQSAVKAVSTMSRGSGALK